MKDTRDFESVKRKTKTRLQPIHEQNVIESETADANRITNKQLPNRKRGGQPVFSEQEITMAEYVADGRVSKMQLQRVAYSNRAGAALMAWDDDSGKLRDPANAWLLDPVKCERGGQRDAWRPAILAELGRHGSSEEIREVAAQLTELNAGHKLSDAESVAVLKAVRLGVLPNAPEQPPTADAGELTALIVDTINEYAETHRKATPALIRKAVANVKIVDPKDN